MKFLGSCGDLNEEKIDTLLNMISQSELPSNLTYQMSRVLNLIKSNPLMSTDDLDKWKVKACSDMAKGINTSLESILVVDPKRAAKLSKLVIEESKIAAKSLENGKVYIPNESVEEMGFANRKQSDHKTNFEDNPKKKFKSCGKEVSADVFRCECGSII